VQCFELFHVACHWAGVVSAEEVSAKGDWGDNEGEYLAAITDGL